MQFIYVGNRPVQIFVRTQTHIREPIAVPGLLVVSKNNYTVFIYDKL